MATSARARSIWLVVGALALVPFFVVGTVQVVSAIAHEEITETRTVPRDDIDRLDVRLDDGSVRVVGRADLEEIRVRADVSEGLHGTDRSVTRQGSSLVVSGRCPGFAADFCSVDYTIAVPADVDVVVRAEFAGVHIGGVTGDVDVETRDGDVVLARGVGDARLGSRDGSIRATFVTPPAFVDASSRDGSVEVVVPRGEIDYQVDAASGDGNATTLVRTAPRADQVIRVRSDDGDVTVRYPHR